MFTLRVVALFLITHDFVLAQENLQQQARDSVAQLQELRAVQRRLLEHMHSPEGQELWFVSNVMGDATECLPIRRADYIRVATEQMLAARLTGAKSPTAQDLAQNIRRMQANSISQRNEMQRSIQERVDELQQKTDAILQRLGPTDSLSQLRSLVENPNDSSAGKSEGEDLSDLEPFIGPPTDNVGTSDAVTESSGDVTPNSVEPLGRVIEMASGKLSFDFQHQVRRVLMEPFFGMTPLTASADCPAITMKISADRQVSVSSADVRIGNQYEDGSGIEASITLKFRRSSGTQIQLSDPLMAAPINVGQATRVIGTGTGRLIARQKGGSDAAGNKSDTGDVAISWEATRDSTRHWTLKVRFTRNVARGTRFFQLLPLVYQFRLETLTDTTVPYGDRMLQGGTFDLYECPGPVGRQLPLQVEVTTFTDKWVNLQVDLAPSADEDLRRRLRSTGYRLPVNTLLVQDPSEEIPFFLARGTQAAALVKLVLMNHSTGEILRQHRVPNADSVLVSDCVIGLGSGSMISAVLHPDKTPTTENRRRIGISIRAQLDSQQSTSPARTVTMPLVGRKRTSTSTQ